ncbi:chloride channel protein [Mesorhizobium sp. SP-1A]|uniref:chloride channel protein n=1 Tax=Mesorhizobium sp. SP-1A TaxID=3077840 RepID=UPI0028F74B6D|nr:chloride channel protein [Mesorhizobium sp. SP-1A]
MKKPALRTVLLAALYGFVAGAAAAAVLWLMGLVSGMVWSGSRPRWYVFVMVMAGGVLIAVLRYWYVGEGLSEQIEKATRRADAQKARDALLLALMAIVAVGFGGAVGPEAGILAVVSELSGLVSMLIARNAAEARFIAETGAAGALGGLYGSPPGGAMLSQDEHAAPRWQIYLAGVAGLLGFLLTASRILPGNPIRIELPPHVSARDGSDMFAAVLPAMVGAASGLLFVLVLPRIEKHLHRLGNIHLQTIVGTALFAALATCFPILLFSGHHELDSMLSWAQDAGMGALLVLALLKALALALCLASGWRGGAAFPLLFIGAAAGAATLVLVPQIPVTVALVAGMSAALTVGMGRPIAAMLIAVLLIGPAALGPLCMGCLVGWGVSSLAPAPKLH